MFVGARRLGLSRCTRIPFRLGSSSTTTSASWYHSLSNPEFLQSLQEFQGNVAEFNTLLNKHQGDEKLKVCQSQRASALYQDLSQHSLYKTTLSMHTLRTILFTICQDEHLIDEIEHIQPLVSQLLSTGRNSPSNPDNHLLTII